MRLAQETVERYRPLLSATTRGYEIMNALLGILVEHGVGACTAEPATDPCQDVSIIDGRAP